MLRIAICDKDKRQRSDILDYIARDLEIEDDCVTECFADERVVRDRLENHDFNYDLLFLGIDALGKSGLSLAAYLRECKVDIDLIFMAESLDLISEGFYFKAFNYIVKPITYERFCYEMSQYLREKREYQNEYLSVLVQGKEQMISLNTVLYFMSEARKIGAVSNYAKEPMWFYGKLDELEDKLSGYGFLRCHQSYLVNIHKIDGTASEQILVKQHMIPVSRRYRDEVKERWGKYKRIHHIRELGREPPDSCDGEGDKQESGIDFQGDNSTLIVTRNHARGAAKYGIVRGIMGARQNETFRIYQGEETVIGRDEKQSQIVVRDNIISRRHCGIRFEEEEQCYYVCDYSSNGTFTGNHTRLEKNEWVRIERDTLIQLTDNRCSFMLI